MNQSLLRDITNIEGRIRASSGISLFLDFDGTLVPLQQEPTGAWLGASMRETLSRIAAIKRITTTIISGRSVPDLLLRIGVEGLIYAGNHGLDICGRQLRFTEPAAAQQREDLKRFSDRLAASLSTIAGTLVEHKGLTITVHYRRAAIRDIAGIESTVRAMVAPAAASMVVRTGKCAFEILPRTDWNKGAAALWINRKLDRGNVLSIYLGDDTTDEDAFRALSDGITVKIGDSTATSARYCLADPSEVHEFLKWMVKHAPA